MCVCVCIGVCALVCVCVLNLLTLFHCEQKFDWPSIWPIPFFLLLSQMSQKSRRRKEEKEKKKKKKRQSSLGKSLVMILFTLFYEACRILAILFIKLPYIMYLVSGHRVPSQGHQIIMLSKCLLLHVLELDTQSETPSLAVTCHKCQSSFLSFFSQECFLSVFHSVSNNKVVYWLLFLCLGFQDYIRDNVSLLTTVSI